MAVGLLILFLVLVLMLVGAGGFYLWSTGASGESRPVTVEIREGATASDIAELLEDNGTSGFGEDYP